eukprot:7247278-Ditylum_brightwellii.AAC.1
MEICLSQPLVELLKIYLWDVFLLGKELTVHGFCTEGIIVGVIHHGGVLSMTYLAKAKHSQSCVVSMPARPQLPRAQ